VKFYLFVPTLNPGPLWSDWVEALRLQTWQPEKVVVIDSGSTDACVALSDAAGFDVHPIELSAFNHAGTRQWALQNFAQDAQVAIWMTQDALLADPSALQKLLAAFEDPRVALVFGRQLPRPQAGAIEAHARRFNYPPQSRTLGLPGQLDQDIAAWGLKACFCSNSFAAYRLDRLQTIGGFENATFLGEDTLAAAKLLLAGQALRYEAEACVWHSHEFSLTQEALRYFQIGRLHQHYPWLRQRFGRASGEGLRFVRSELLQLAEMGFFPALRWVPEALLRSALKWLSFQAGLAL
jgi:rhamnosyltransferase